MRASRTAEACEDAAQAAILAVGEEGWAALAKGATAEVIGIIPARGGSKGVPRKNVLPLAGKPLIVWTIDAALRCETITRVVVSTDDDEIAATAEAAGAEVVRRPAELAADTSPTEPAMLHVLDTLRDSEGYEPDAVALLQCTSPLRGAEIIDAGVRLLLDSGCDAVMTVTGVQHWYLAGQIGEDVLFAAEYDYARRPRSQDMPHKYRENGALYVTRGEAFRRFGNRLGGEVRVLVMDPVRSLDIDTWDDFHLVEEVLGGLKP